MLGTLIVVFVITGLQLAQPMLMRWIIDTVYANGQWDLLGWGCLAILGTAILSGVLGYVQRYGMSWAGQKIIFDIRNKLYEHLQQLSFSFYDQAQTGQLMSRVTADVEQTRMFLSMQMINIIAAIVRFIATFILMCSIDWKLTLMAMIPVPLLIWRVQVYATVIRPMFWAIQQQLAELTVTLQENITGQRVVKAFARKDFEAKKFENDNLRLLERNVKTVRTSAFNDSLMAVLIETCLALVLLFGGIKIVRAL